MYSRFPRNRVCIALATLLGLTIGSGTQGRAEPAADPPQQVTATTLFPAGGAPPPQDSHEGSFRHDPAVLADGRRLFIWYNCVGCHFNGGGGIGPALSDDRWLYGNRIDQVFASVDRGRPNGMPSWRGKIPSAQIWEIAAYVLSLGPQIPPEGGTQPPAQ
jgi:cytochrome c oxidase cbb3-type subunit 3